MVLIQDIVDSICVFTSSRLTTHLTMCEVHMLTYVKMNSQLEGVCAFSMRNDKDDFTGIEINTQRDRERALKENSKLTNVCIWMKRIVETA